MHYQVLEFTSASQAGGWSNPSNALSQGSPYASISNANSLSTNYLRLTNASADLPSDAVVKGFAVMLRGKFPGVVSMDPDGPGDVERKASNFEVYLTHAGARVGSEGLQFLGMNELWPTFADEWSGSASWKFMTSLLTVAQMNSDTFGIEIVANGPKYWNRSHSGLEPDYSVLSYVDGTFNYTGGNFLIDIAKLVVFMEYSASLAGTGYCNGSVDFSWE